MTATNNRLGLSAFRQLALGTGGWRTTFQTAMDNINDRLTLLSTRTATGVQGNTQAHFVGQHCISNDKALLFAKTVGGATTALWSTPIFASLVMTSTGRSESIIVAVGNETSAITAGTAKITFRMPYAMTVTSVGASLSTAQTSGAIFTVDINDSGVSILSTKITIDNTEKTSATAATPAVISDTALALDAEITIDVDQIGNGSAKGLKVTINGRRT